MTIFTSRLRLAAIGAAGLLLAFGVTLPAHATDPPEPDRQASLVGRVTDAATFRAIDGATITLTRSETDPPEPDRTITNHGGHYLFQGLHSGDYVVTVHACGYLPPGGSSTDSRPTTVRLNAVGVSHLDISLPPDPITPPDPCAS